MHKSMLGYKNIININRPMDYACLEENLADLQANFKFMDNIIIGESYLGKNLNLVRLGNGAHKVIYIGSHHAMEWLTSIIHKINLQRQKARLLPTFIVLQLVKYYNEVVCQAC